MRIAVALGYMERLDPISQFPFNSKVWNGKITEVSDIHSGVEEASWNEEPKGDSERTGFSQTLPAQTCFRQTEHFTRTGFLLYSF